MSYIRNLPTSLKRKTRWRISLSAAQRTYGVSLR